MSSRVFASHLPWRYEIYCLVALAFLGLIVLVTSKTHWKTRPLTLTIIGFAVLQLIAYGNILVIPFYHWYTGPQIVAVSALSAITVTAALTRFKRSAPAKILAVPTAVLFA